MPAALDGRFDLTQVLSSVQRPSQAVVLRVKDREARHASADVPLVLKWYHHRFGPDPGVRRILAEGPGGPGGPVAGLLESGTADGHPYDLTLSYGETDLARYRADRPGPLPPALVRAVVEQLHAALVAVHARDIVHRDVTPDNIMVRIQNEDRPELVLIDFGAAVHEPQHDRPRRRDWVGKPLYLAPEAAPHRQAVTPAVDWWSLGMVVAELAGGSHPIDFRGDEEVLTEVATHDPELPLVTDPRLLTLCQGLLTRAPEHRWGGEQVAAWLRGRPRRSRPAPPAPHCATSRPGAHCSPSPSWAGRSPAPRSWPASWTSTAGPPHGCWPAGADGPNWWSGWASSSTLRAAAPRRTSSSSPCARNSPNHRTPGPSHG